LRLDGSASNSSGAIRRCVMMMMIKIIIMIFMMIVQWLLGHGIRELNCFCQTHEQDRQESLDVKGSNDCVMFLLLVA
jgi:hypothetical protein